MLLSQCHIISVIRSNCFNSRDGGFQVTFSGNQTLYGSYGGTEGKPARAFIDFIIYGFYIIEVCPQSPVVIQYQSGTPFRLEPIDGFGIINCDLYNRVLGRGKALGVTLSVPATDDADHFFVTVRISFTFPSSVCVVHCKNEGLNVTFPLPSLLRFFS